MREPHAEFRVGEPARAKQPATGLLDAQARGGERWIGSADLRRNGVERDGRGGQPAREHHSEWNEDESNHGMKERLEWRK